MAVEDRGAVVVGVGVGGETEDEPIDFGGGDADGEALFGGGLPGQVHDAGGDVAVEVAVQRVVYVRGGVVEGAHLADHGEDGGEGVFGRGGEGDVEDGGGVDYGVDGAEVVCCCCLLGS